MPGRTRTLLLAVACAAALAAPASAAISDTHLVDGPSGDVLDVGGVAMSEDGTAGIVYRKRVDGRAHVFAALFSDGEWGVPQRVDVGQAFDSSWPRIGAGNRGRLVVTWVQEFGAGSDRMYSAALDPGATRFQAPVPVDFNVGEANATWPTLAMNRGGSAYLVYRVVTDTSAANPPGYVGAELRLARYTGSLWTLAGGVLDRSPSIPVRAPTAQNAPRVGIDIQGNGIVAFQEPGDDFVDRIWARRVFGSQLGIPLQVSPSSWDGAPLRGGADAFSLDVAGFGQGAVAFRQQPGEGGRLGAARIMVNEIPDSFSDGAGAFGTARVADGEVRADPGPPTVAVAPLGPFRSIFAAGGAVLSGSGDADRLDPIERIDDGAAAGAPDPLVDLSESSAAVAAWRAQGGAEVRELRADGVPETVLGAAPAGGAVGGLELAGSGLGDAIVGFQQGAGQVAAVIVDAPPEGFFIQVPDRWVRAKALRVGWDPSPSAISGVTYTVTVDDEPVKERLRGGAARLGPSALEDGRHTIQVVAVDAAGQETVSQAGQVRVDRHKPQVRLRLRGRTLSVAVGDGRRARSSGLRRASTAVSFGDGAAARRRPGTRHVYTRAGTYRITIRARDRAGNRTLLQRRVTVR
jgi:hypothetical protein